MHVGDLLSEQLDSLIPLHHLLIERMCKFLHAQLLHRWADALDQDKFPFSIIQIPKIYEVRYDLLCELLNELGVAELVLCQVVNCVLQCVKGVRQSE